MTVSTCSFDEPQMSARQLKKWRDELAEIDPKAAEHDRWLRSRHGQVVTDLRLLLGTDSIDSIAGRLGYSDPTAMIASLRSWGETALMERVMAERESLRLTLDNR